jgi:hypothetical protein
MVARFAAAVRRVAEEVDAELTAGTGAA